MYEDDIPVTRKVNSFSYEWLFNRPHFDREAEGNSERNSDIFVIPNITFQGFMFPDGWSRGTRLKALLSNTLVRLVPYAYTFVEVKTSPNIRTWKQRFPMAGEQTLTVKPWVDVDTAGHSASNEVCLWRTFQFPKKSKGTALIPIGTATEKAKENKLINDEIKNLLKQPDSAKTSLGKNYCFKT